jgi:hypothetical protein
VVHASCAAAISVATFMAWQLWRETDAASDPVIARRHFLAGLAAGSGLFSALVVLAMWIPSWLLSPCFA